jgi:hypothetical protein
MQLLSLLPIRPFRLAFDDLSIKDKYINSIKLAAHYGVKYFSNYLLYNFTETPDELYERLKINIELAKELNVSIYSFPMLYAPVNKTVREYIGAHWNRHYLKNVRSILHVTRGVVAKEEDFFQKAFGSNLYEFNMILTLPRDFLVYRNYFEKIGLTDMWKKEYENLYSLNKLNTLHSLLSDSIFKSDDPDIERIMVYYKLNYKKIKRKLDDNIKNIDILNLI